MFFERANLPLTKSLDREEKLSPPNPIVQNYLSLSRELADLKRSLRSQENIQAIIKVSKKQLALKAQLKELLALEQKQRHVLILNQVVLWLALALITWGFFSLFRDSF